MPELLSEKAGQLDIEIEEGADFITTLTWRDENSVLIDLTNYTAKMQVRKKAGLTGTPDLELTHLSGLTLGGVNGTIGILITAAQNVFRSQNYVYDLELTDSGGTVTRLIRGSITSISEVTK